VSAPDDDRSLRSAAAVEPLGPGRYGATLSEYYNVVGHPNGGYLQCVMANGALAPATAEGAHHLHAISIATTYATTPEPGPVELVCEVRRVGRAVSFVHVTLIQDDVMRVESLVTLGILKEDSTARYMDATAPELAPLNECRQAAPTDEINLLRVVDVHLDRSVVDWRTGELSETGEVRGWVRLNDGDSSWDALSVLFACDVMPPATFPLGSSGWVPTLTMTSYVRRIPRGEWLKARQWCLVIADGTVDERCELFDERGELVAWSSQLAMVRFPGGHQGRS
jgi:acyl-coenzyme A thioesterase PaaI-like protein